MNNGHNRVFRAITLLITNTIKVAGVVIVLKEVFAPTLPDTNRAEVLAVAAFMMAGAQLSETLILAAMDRLMGGSGRQETEGKG